MKDIEKAFQNYTHVDKIRIAKFVTQTITSQIPEINSHNGMMNTVLGLLAKGDINCAGGEIDPNGDLFAQQKPQPVETPEQRRARQASEIPAGVIRTAEEIRRAEEEAQRKKDEEERIAREKAEEEAREQERIRKENSTWNKIGRWLKKTATDIVKEEE